MKKITSTSEETERHEIIKIFKEIEVLNLINHLSEYEKKDYLFCIKIFKAWCKFVEYPYNECSFYYFIREFDTININYDRIIFGGINLRTLHLLDFKSIRWFELGLIRYINETTYPELFNIKKILIL